MIVWVVTYPHLVSDTNGWVYLTKEEATTAIKNANTKAYPNINKKLFKIEPFLVNGTLKRILKTTNPELFL
jgi:hypothetical protein